MRDYANEHELRRRDLWSSAWNAVARAENTRRPDTATSWADAALKSFDIRFKKLRNDKEDL